MASSRRRALTGALVVAAVGLAGCGGGGGAADSATTATSAATSISDAPTSESTTTTTAAPTDEEAILAAYQGYWDTWLAANDPPNPDHPDLAKYATGEALERARRTISDHAEQNHAVRLREGGVYVHRPAVVEQLGETALVEDCSLDDGLVVDRPSGLVLDDSVWSRKNLVHMTRVGGAWRVDFITLEGKWPGAAGCGR
jgi:hypothetical protein